MDADRLKKAYRLEYYHLPNPQGINVVQIQGIDSEEAGQPPNTYWRHNLMLVGYRVPLRLNNTRIDVLSMMFGRETEGWIGKKIGLMVNAVSHYGKTEMNINIVVTPPPPDTPITPLPQGSPVALALPPGGATAFGPQSAATHGAPQMADPWAQHRASIAPPTAPSTAQVFDQRPIGTKNADKFKSALAEQGATYDEFIVWAKRHAADVHARIHDRVMAEWGYGAKDAMQRFLREYKAPIPGSPTEPPLVEPEELDIPF